LFTWVHVPRWRLTFARLVGGFDFLHLHKMFNDKTMINIREKYKEFCESRNIEYQNDTSILSYDDTSLFCPAGMQQFKSQYSDSEYKGTISNIQSCLRLNDLDEIGDGTHMLYFNMIGLFSFREMSLEETIIFWIDFIESLGLRIDYITIHPDKVKEWSKYYLGYNIEVREDSECIWSDGGDLGGYCTEFYINDIEIGNIVNTSGDCIDVGFGLERLDMILNNTIKSETDVLKESIEKIIESGIYPSNNNHGYILKKLIRILIRKGEEIESGIFQNEKIKFEKMIQRYHKLKTKEKNQNQSKEWWFDTHGIIIDEIE
jgi:alanyl-tRNA synthetase